MCRNLVPLGYVSFFFLFMVFGWIRRFEGGLCLSVWLFNLSLDLSSLLFVC